MELSLASVKQLANDYLLPIGLRIVVALVVFFVGRAISRALLRGFERLMERSKLDISLRKFLADVAYAVLLVAVMIAALDTVGIKTTAVIAVLGAAGLAVGLALQGSLSNFAAGVMLIMLRPYKVGDLVVIGKYLGRVEVIKVFNTVLITGDHREITIPNGQIIAAPIENLTVLGNRRIDFVVKVNQAADLGQVRTLLSGVVVANPRIHPVPAPTIEVAEISDVSVSLHVRPWTAVEDYNEVAAEMMERIRDAMMAGGVKFAISVPLTTA